jgi:alpha-tubulin suppressor-like RCC1 family protein
VLSFGQLGRKDSQKNFHVDSDVPFRFICCGALTSCALSDTGRVFVWGALNDATLTTSQSAPRQVEHRAIYRDME